MRRHFDFFPRPRTLMPSLAGAVIMGLVLWLLDDAPVVVLVPLGVALYAAIVYVISPRSREVVLGTVR